MSAPLLSGRAGWAAEPPVAADGLLRGPPLNRGVKLLSRADGNGKRTLRKT